MRTVLALTCVALLPLPAFAEDEKHVMVVTLSKVKKPGDARVKEPLDRIHLHVWLPGDVKVFRGAVFNPFNDKQAEQAHWQEAARLWGFAVIGADYFGVD